MTSTSPSPPLFEDSAASSPDFSSCGEDETTEFPEDTLLLPKTDNDDDDDDDDDKHSSTRPSALLSVFQNNTKSARLLLWLQQLLLQRLFPNNNNQVSQNQFLSTYVHFVSSAANQDKLLKLLQWSLWIGAQTLLSVQKQQQQNRTTSTLSRTLTPLTSTSSSVLVPWLLKLYGEVSFARYVTRLLGFPVAVEAALHNSWTTTMTPPTTTGSKEISTADRIQKLYPVIGKILSYSMVAYHPTELLAYVLWMKPSLSTVDAASSHFQKRRRSTLSTTSILPNWSAETWSAISCRFWLAYVVAELVQCGVQWCELRSLLLLHPPTTTRVESNSSNEPDASEQEQQRQQLLIKAKMTNTALQGLRDVLFVVPCIQWSLPSWDKKPWLPSSTINTLMWFESIVCIYQAIRNNTQSLSE